jgi:hypothetical protein
MEKFLAMAPSTYYARLSSSSEEVEEEANGLLNEKTKLQRRSWTRFLWPIAIVVLSLSNLTFLSLWLKSTKELSKAQNCIRPKLSYSPALEAIEYQKKTLDRDIQHNVFTGDPRPELDEAWAKLIEPISIKITAEELAQVGYKSIPFKDGSGYLAELSVYHELHCVKQVRRHLHLDYYGQFKNATQSEIDFENAHISKFVLYIYIHFSSSATVKKYIQIKIK